VKNALAAQSRCAAALALVEHVTAGSQGGSSQEPDEWTNETRSETVCPVARAIE
jgi:hypothetical protein